MTQIKKLKLATEGTENAEERIKIKLSGLCELGGEEKNMEMKRKNESRNTNHEPTPLTNGLGESRIRAGSALILVVVLTSLLAIVGVMFVMVARVDRIATSAISENKTLDSAVEAVIAKISQELVLDVPGVGGQPDYYDYPDGENAWLASLEPHKDGGYKWRQISDVYNKLGLSLELDAEIIPDYQKPSDVGDSNSVTDYPADADGDGVADSKWIELDDITSSKGKPIYAAIRVTDNGGMINVNTAYQFNPASPGTDGEYIDGSDQMQINLEALARVGDTIDEIEDARNPDDKPLLDYQDEVIWKMEDPCSDYLPFDISDELELRNRFFLTTLAKTRLEDTWFSTIGHSNFKRVPYDGQGVYDEDHWWRAINQDANQPDRRHFLTTYNMDRIINPYGGKMVNVNRDSKDSIYNAIKADLFTADPNFKDIDEIAAQTAVNLIDFRDNDSNVAAFDPPPTGGTIYYGFERPCIYISELAHKFVKPDTPPGIPVPGSLINRSYAIELHKPYTEDDYPDVNQWQLRLEGYGTFPVDWSGTRHFHVMLFEHPNAPLEPEVFFDPPDADPNLPPPSAEKTESLKPGTIVFASGKTIALERLVGADWISVDSVTVQYGPGPPYKVWDTDDKVHSYQRDITLHKCIRRLWDDLFNKEFFDTLGSNNGYTDLSTDMIQAHPENRAFTNVGEIGMVFRKGAYYQNDIDRPDRIGYGLNKDEEQVRLDLADPNYHNIFKYLTVWPPSEYVSDPNETRIKGRININTAPWYVIAQLPWMADKIAQAIVAYRDKAVIPDQNNINYSDRYAATDIDGLREEEGFASIAELATVVNDSGEDEYSMRYYILGDEENDDLAGFPDLTPGGSTGDDAIDDFEERDVIFARLSNLVTVRSDVFTAYILVRIGADGPQKRVMAILDRSNVYPPEGGKVRIVALHAVADPR